MADILTTGEVNLPGFRLAARCCKARIASKRSSGPGSREAPSLNQTHTNTMVKLLATSSICESLTNYTSLKKAAPFQLSKGGVGGLRRRWFYWRKRGKQKPGALDCANI